MTNELVAFLVRAEALLARVEAMLPASPGATDWSAHAYRWRKRNGGGCLEAVFEIPGHLERHRHFVQLCRILKIPGVLWQP